MKLHLISLGCARNLVDSEVMLGELQRQGYSVVDDIEKAEMGFTTLITVMLTHSRGGQFD